MQKDENEIQVKQKVNKNNNKLTQNLNRRGVTELKLK